MSNGESSISSSHPSIEDAIGDIVAVFQTSFHHIQGNTLDWSTTIDDDLYAESLKGVEFSSMPSGLHGVEDDVVFFMKGDLDAVSVFRRRKLPENYGKRGYAMETFGVLLGPSPYPRPWRHVTALQRIEDRTSLESYFHERKYDPASLANPPQSSSGWESELAGPSHPLLHLPHFMRVIGPSFLTMFKYVLARKRVLLYTNAPVQTAGLLAKVCVDIAFGVPGSGGRSPSRDDRRPKALGTVGLIDMDMLKAESAAGLGWIGCTTDALFLERPALYDLIVDLTAMNPPISASSIMPITSTPVSRPTLYISYSPSSSAAKLQQVRFTFSDIRVWNRIDQALRGADTCDASHAHESEDQRERTWVDAFPWRFYTYEDMCVVCGSMWINGEDSSVGKVRLEGPDMGLLESTEGDDDPVVKALPTSSKDYRRCVVRRQSAQSGRSVRSFNSEAPASPAGFNECRSGQSPEARLPLLLIKIFHSHADMWMDNLGSLIESKTSKPKNEVMAISPLEMTRLQLSAFSEMDSRFVASLAKARLAKQVAVRRGWKDLAAAAVGL
ncbi:hypothetical protein FRB97_008921 [Tulasnella sp. 331]|nr:hypothetical protein FRB97_008921 [Tulasnella sp. 331]KAG8873831.1 hypothetical protein FRB98_008769 [Tulasnella sp. 332]